MSESKKPPPMQNQAHLTHLRLGPQLKALFSTMSQATSQYPNTRDSDLNSRIHLPSVGSIRVGQGEREAYNSLQEEKQVIVTEGCTMRQLCVCLFKWKEPQWKG